MKIAGYIITPLGVLAFIGTLLGGHSPIGPLFWIVVGITLLILGYRKEKLPISRENRNKKDNISDAEPAQLLQEIIKQTSPENFMDPYNAERVKNATVLHHKAKDIDADQPLAVLDLMENTIKELDCNYSSELVYKYLLEIFNPTNNRGEFDWRNTICQKLYNAKNDIAEMTLIVRREIEKKETQEKIELEQLRQEKLRQQQLKEEERKKETIRILKVIGIVIAIIAVFLIVYIPIDYHRINKEKPNIWSLKDFRTEKVNKKNDGRSNYEICYLINIPNCIDNHKYGVERLINKNTSTKSCHVDCSFYDSWNNYIDVAITTMPIKDFVSEKVSRYIDAGFKIDYKISTDTIVWFTYDKYSLYEGRLVGNCIYMLKPSPLEQSPFPLDENNILVCCDGYGVTEEIADSIAESIRIKIDNIPNNEYGVTYKLKKYRSVRKGDWLREDKLYDYDDVTTRINFILPYQHAGILSLNQSVRYSLNNYGIQWYLTPANDAGLYIKSMPTTSIINFVYPIDSIVETSSTKCKVAGCSATKVDATGYYNNREYKYILYQLIKDNGYSEYREPIYGKETYCLSDEELALSLSGTYVNGVRINPSRTQTRTILKGYKAESKNIKNDDLYLCLLFGMTPEWYEKNKDSIDAIINSIQITEN